MELTIKTRETGIPTQLARETGASWADTSVYDRWNLLLKLDWVIGFFYKWRNKELVDYVGFKPSTRGRQMLSWLLEKDFFI